MTFPWTSELAFLKILCSMFYSLQKYRKVKVYLLFLLGDWKFGYVVCQFWLSVDYTASTASIFNLSILSLDRYWSITTPLRYLRRRTKKRALIMIALAWTGASMWVVPVLGWHHMLHGGKRQQPGKTKKPKK